MLGGWLSVSSEMQIIHFQLMPLPPYHLLLHWNPVSYLSGASLLGCPEKEVIKWVLLLMLLIFWCNYRKPQKFTKLKQLNNPCTHFSQKSPKKNKKEKQKRQNKNKPLCPVPFSPYHTRPAMTSTHFARLSTDHKTAASLRQSTSRLAPSSSWTSPPSSSAQSPNIVVMYQMPNLHVALWSRDKWLAVSG